MKHMNMQYSMLALAAFLASCAGIPKEAAPPTPVPLGSVVANEAPARGALIDAIEMRMESPEPIVRNLDKSLIGLKLDTALLERAGFFDAVASLRPSMLPVRQFKIHYWSEDPKGRPIKLSGALFLPLADAGQGKAVPLVLICHGTQLNRAKVPSRMLGSERQIGILAASTGLAALLPDYPGMGDADGFHPYCLAASLEAMGVDMLRAVRRFLSAYAKGAYAEAPRTYVGGYSEGGYVAMAVLKGLMTRFKGEFPLAMGFPMAAPCDMSGAMRRTMAGIVPIPSPYYLAYTLLGWAPFYPELDPMRMLDPAYIDALLPLMDGTGDSGPVNAMIAELQGVPKGRAVASLMLRAEWREAIANPGSNEKGLSVLAALRENDLHDWEPDPSVPMKLCHSRADELVPYENSVATLEAMRGRGGRIELVELTQKSHSDSGIEAYGLMLLDIWKDAGEL
jgi:pimeloyl-ACP methyl ester carboxylesterase